MSSVTFYPTVGQNYTGTNVGSFDWTNPGNILADDASFATIVLSPTNNSKWLDTRTYGFSIPTDATIVGITIALKIKSDNGLPQLRGMQLLQGGVLAGNNKATNASISSTLTVLTFGAATDLWGATWTPSDINSANFGAAFYVGATVAGGATISADSMQVTVYYSQTNNGSASLQASHPILSSSGTYSVTTISSTFRQSKSTKLTAVGTVVNPQWPSSGNPTQYPTIAQTASYGTVSTWTNTSNIFADDGAVASINLAAGFYSYWLEGLGLGYNLPAGSIVNGIVVEVKCRMASASNTAKLADAQLVKSGAVVGTGKGGGSSIIANLTNSFAVYTLGSSTDLWGTTWTASDINNTNFGAALCFGGLTNTSTVEVDFIRVTVYYSSINVTGYSRLSKSVSLRDVGIKGPVANSTLILGHPILKASSLYFPPYKVAYLNLGHPLLVARATNSPPIFSAVGRFSKVVSNTFKSTNTPPSFLGKSKLTKSMAISSAGYATRLQSAALNMFISGAAPTYLNNTLDIYVKGSSLAQTTPIAIASLPIFMDSTYLANAKLDMFIEGFSVLRTIKNTMNIFLANDPARVSNELPMFLMADQPKISGVLPMYIKGAGLNVGYYYTKHTLNLFIEGYGSGDLTTPVFNEGILEMFIQGSQTPVFTYNNILPMFLKAADGNVVNNSLEMVMEGADPNLITNTLDIVIYSTLLRETLPLFIRGI